MTTSGDLRNFTTFNNKLIDFADDLSGVIGHLPEYGLLTSSVRFMAQFNVRQNQQFYDQYVGRPFGASILARDEKFFLEEASFEADQGNLVALIKSVWRSLSKADQDSIWQHMQVLVVLSERCNNQ